MAISEFAASGALAVVAVYLPTRYMAEHRECCAAWRKGHPWRLTHYTMFAMGQAWLEWSADAPRGDRSFDSQDDAERRLAPLVEEYQRKHVRHSYRDQLPCIIKFSKEGYILDGWARRLCAVWEGRDLRFYSAGPNGVDESGLGDDIAGPTLAYVRRGSSGRPGEALNGN